MISLGIIEKELMFSPEFRVVSSSLERSEDIKLYGFSPLSLARKGREHWLYVADERSDLSVLARLRAGAVIWLGDSAPEQPRGVGLLCCQTDDHGDFLPRMYDFLEDCFARYQQWEEELDRCVETEDSQRMLDLSAPLFRATVSLFDSEYHWLGISGPEYSFYRENNRQLPADFVRAVIEDHREQEVRRHRRAFVSPDPENYFNTQALCYNLFVQELYWGRIVVMDHRENRVFLPGDHWMLNLLGERMQALLRLREGDLWSPGHSGVSAVCRVVHRLLNQEPVEAEELRSAIARAGWRENERFFVGHLFLNRETAPASAKAFYCRYVMQENPHVAAMEAGNHILLLIPQSVYKDISSFLSGFVLILRENNFRLGISNPCHDLAEVPCYYSQAMEAFAIGSRRKPHYWYHIFSDYTIDYLLRPNQDIPARSLCREELLTLASYDRKNDTEYVKTLKTYIHNQMNAVQTAKDLYIHHATMVFRLKRLKEIMGTDLKDMEQMVALYLSLRILEEEL